MAADQELGKDCSPGLETSCENWLLSSGSQPVGASFRDLLWPRGVQRPSPQEEGQAAQWLGTWLCGARQAEKELGCKVYVGAHNQISKAIRADGQGLDRPLKSTHDSV